MRRAPGQLTAIEQSIVNLVTEQPQTATSIIEAIDCHPSTVYRALLRLVRSGAIESDWHVPDDAESQRPYRIYVAP